VGLLETEGLEKRFGGVIAVRGVSLTIRPMELVGVIGANGAGKTTLFSLIAGNQRPSAGSITFNGERIDGLRPDQVSRRGIARTFQIVRPFPNLTVLDNVLIGVLFGRGQEPDIAIARQRAMAVLTDVGLGPRAHSLASELTLAGRKRLEVARALAAEPRLLMLDEVLAGLTPTEVEQAISLIRKVRTKYNLTILMVEHVLRAVMQLCERVIALHHGEKIAEGTPAEISNHPAVISAYLGRKR
jgi:branched-chain amino acid transport system ATP-binding protein